MSRKEISIFIAALSLLFIMPFNFISSGIILCLVFLIGLLFIFQANQDDFYFLFSLFCISFIFRLLAGIFMYEFGLFTGQGEFIGDGLAYFWNADNMLNIWLLGSRNIEAISSYIKNNYSATGTIGFYDFWNAMILLFSGRMPIAIVYVNILAGLLTIVFVYQITRELCAEKRAARLSAILCAFWPSTFLWSVQNLKEPITTFLICGLILYFIGFLKRPSFYYIFMAYLFGFGLKIFREQFFIIFCLGVVPIGLFFYLLQAKAVKIHILVFLIAIIFAGGYFFFSGEWIVKFQKLSLKSLLDYAYTMRTDRAYGNTAFLQNIDFTNIPSFLMFLPLSLLTIFLAPFPWQLLSPAKILILFEMLFYYALIYFMFKGGLLLFKNRVREAVVLIISIFIISIFLALFEGNIGTIYRHRAMVLPLIFILASIGIEKRRQDIKII